MGKHYSTALLGGLTIASACLAFTSPLQAQDTPAALLKKVADRYKSLSGYDIKADITYSIVKNGQSGGGQSKTELALGKEGRFRVEHDTGGTKEIRASDGKIIWKELPHLKAWSKQEASLAVSSADEEDDSGEPNLRMDLFGTTEQSFVKRYSGVSRYAQNAQLEKEERLKLNGSKVDCVVIHIPTKSGDNRLSIAKDSGWVVRHVEVTNSRDQTRTQITTDYRTLESEPPTADYFAFKPAKGSKEVADLMLPSERNLSLVGQRAADFTLKDLDGAPVHLAALQGKIVLLDFWASWCPPCRRELPTIEALSRKYKDHNVLVLGINDEDARTARRFLEQRHPGLSSLHDEKGTVHRMYGCYSIPTVMVIDASGKIVSHFVGERQESELLAALKLAGMQ